LLKKWQLALLTVLALVGLALAVTDIVLFTGNREAQNEFTTRAQYIQQAQQLEPLHQGIIRNLAEIAAQTNDPQIRQMLAAQGITFTVNAPPDKAESKEGAREQKGKAK
jgi:hypothetical protein